MLLEGTKPAAMWQPGEGTPAQIDELHRGGFLLVEIEERLPRKPRHPGQQSLVLGRAAQPPRARFIARDWKTLARLLRAWRYGNAADVGRALGYSEADIAVYARHTRSELLPGD
jgi:hypothetical protein